MFLFWFLLTVVVLCVISNSKHQKKQQAKRTNEDQNSGRGNDAEIDAEAGLRAAFDAAARQDEEIAAVKAMPELAPKEIRGYKQKYHYSDVLVWLDWQNRNHYGEGCKGLGLKRGDPIELISSPDEDDPQKIAVKWGGLVIGQMKINRLRGMVLDWQKAGLPVFCEVSSVGGESNLMLEIALYGVPQTRAIKKTENGFVTGQISAEHIQQCKKCFIAVDTETTGLDPKLDRMIEISAVRFCDFEPISVFTSLVKPDCEIKKGAAKVNHITAADLENAPSEKDAMKAFCRFIGKDAIDGKIHLAAHNALFDKEFIATAAARCKLRLDLKFNDTAALSRLLLPGLENYRLGTVANHLNIQQAQAHRAADDALVCGKIFVALLSAEEAAQAKLQAAKEQSATAFEREVCQWIHDTLKDAGCDLEHLSFHVSTYLSVHCWRRVVRLKPRAKRPYILVDACLDLPTGIETAPATKSEGEGLKRVFFTKAGDLAVVSDWLVGEYDRIAKDTARFYLMGGVYKQEIDRMKETQFVTQ